MTLTITLPDPLAELLQRRAKLDHDSPERIALHILQNALDWDDFPTPEEVAAKLKALPPSTTNRRQATGSLADVLRKKPVDSEFDYDEWNRQWTQIEAEMKTIDRINDIAEGRL